MFMSTPGAYEELIALVKEGALAESVLDEAVKRILTVKLQLGLFDQKPKPVPVNLPAHQALNEQLQQQSIVLLKNNGVLPPCKPENHRRWSLRRSYPRDAGRLDVYDAPVYR